MGDLTRRIFYPIQQARRSLDYLDATSSSRGGNQVARNTKLRRDAEACGEDCRMLGQATISLIGNGSGGVGSDARRLKGLLCPIVDHLVPSSVTFGSVQSILPDPQ